MTARHKARVAGGDDDSALLAMPREPTRTEAQRAEAERAEAEHRLWARRNVARWSMLTTHGCSGRSCHHRAHGKDAAARDALLDELGIGGGG